MSCATLKRPLDSDLFSPNSRPAAKRRRLANAARGLFGVGGASSASICRDGPPSPFTSVTARMSPEQMQVRLRQEIRQLRRLKQLQEDATTPTASNQRAAGSTSSTFENFGENMKSGIGMSKDSALFTFRQVGLICERMLQEKEDALRNEYEQILSAKMAEQYDTFVKFTHDQIQKRFEAASAPSYLS
ncbi:akirin [Folsomia candida]|uniref:akirin n=1 Tax=Folsomia candida TaxID=158441 RepID=UPI000B90528C|nr:akirin [Folsomia candida]